jgi:HSP20 family protein
MEDLSMTNPVPFGGRNLFDELFRDFTPSYYVKPLHGDALPRLAID